MSRKRDDSVEPLPYLRSLGDTLIFNLHMCGVKSVVDAQGQVYEIRHQVKGRKHWYLEKVNNDGD